MLRACGPMSSAPLHRLSSQNPQWNEIQGSIGEVCEWDGNTTIQHPPFFADLT
ncbi:MAG: hypothetical protein IPK32_25320 [Verrucomicrobiaceae bacterium]|nr:hypothetical protein [Verrucomicrobiaceae bacterium]